MTVLAKTSDDYKPVIAIFPSGKTERRNCLKERIHTAEQAVALLAQGQSVRVLEDDKDTVLSEMTR